MLLSLATTGLLVLQESGPQTPPQQRVGRLADGGFLLNSGWMIRPAGNQVPVDTFPMSSAVSSDSKYLLVLNGGYNPPSVSVIDIAAKRELRRTTLPDAWLGLTFAPKSNTVYVGGGSKGAIYELTFNAGQGTLTRTREFTAANAGGKGMPFIGDVAVSPDAHLLYAADLYNDGIAVINLQSGQVIDHWKTGRRPYRILVAPGGRRLFVSSWADGTVTQLDANSGAEISKTRVGPHATDMLLLAKPAPTEEGRTENIARLFVAASNTNNVYSFGVTREGSLTPLETINLSLTPMHPLGMTPSALAVDGDGNRLFTVCSDANAVAMVNISQPQSRVLGFIPTGWYPTAVTALHDGGFVILNGKGLGSRANPDGPVPTKKNQPLYEGGPVVSPGYVGHIQTGTAQFVQAVADEDLSAHTETVRRNSPYRDEIIYGPIQDEQTAFFANTQEHASPIQHVIYVIKENRTYDQVLGDMEKGNGDKSLTLFGEQVTPNLHQLARDFVLYDNFYENADVSADGHNWAAAAIAPDYTMKTWPNEYAGRKKNYDFEGGEPANTPPAGYIWNNALQAGITVRSYGEWAQNLPLKQVTGTRQIEKARDPALAPYMDMNYRGFDLEYSDVDRAKEFIREWKEFEAKGQAPQISIVRMGNDHTSGTKAGALTPLAFNADNDYAVGLLTEAVSHSRFWGSAAIFIIEDDAQNGPDHVDSHRAPAWVISPYTRRGAVDSNMYNQTSVLRTIEMIVGLRPLTHFDAAARPMFASFSRQPNTKPFTAITPKTSITERNAGSGVGAKESAQMDFSEEDRIDDDELNNVLWRAIKHSTPPAPVRSGFTH
ncbi:MAG: bifunctional YncE family protein/alkaline phosphatase family protein [Bryobacteraceae bacterium]